MYSMMQFIKHGSKLPGLLPLDPYLHLSKSLTAWFSLEGENDTNSKMWWFHKRNYKCKVKRLIKINWNHNEITLFTCQMAKIKRTDETKWWGGCRTHEIIICCCWKYKLLQPLWKTTWYYLLKLNICLSCGSAVWSLVFISDKGAHVYIQRLAANVNSHFIHRSQKI